MFEATIKVVEALDADAMRLAPDSENPAHKPIVVRKSDMRDGEEIAIVGKVLGYYRKA